MKNNNKKGNISIMGIINILIFILAFATLVNLIMISTQYLHLSSIGNEVARTIATQSGLRTSTPVNYPGGNVGYYTTHEILNYLDVNMEASGFVDYELKINGTTIGRSTSKSVNYRNAINIELLGKYKWLGLDGFIPGLSSRDQYIIVNKTVYAEYRH